MAVKISKEDYVKAFSYTKNNKDLILSGERCGCFACTNLFYTYEIQYWICNEYEETALCPYCFQDALIGENSGFTITREFLIAMNEHWYGEVFWMYW